MGKWKNFFNLSLHRRFVITIMAFFANMICYCMRGTFGLALVQMVAHAPANDSSSTQQDPDTCDPPANKSVDPGYAQGDFSWDSTTEGQILSSFYYGYLITQIPSGYLAGFVGAKILFAIGIGSTGVFTLLAPVAARSVNGPSALSGIRALAGLAQGICFPLLPAIFGRWAPPQERTLILSVAAAGTQAGTVLGNIICGYIGSAYGWEYMFYLFGTIGLVFVIPWMLFVFDSPEHHPHITAMERSYIISSIGAPAMGNQASKVPWKAVIRSMPFWSLVVVCWCSDWGFYTLLSDVPLYLRDVLHFSLTNNALMSSIPYIVMWFVVVSLSPMGDYIITREKMTVTTFRKTATVLGLVIPGIFLLLIPLAGCDATGIIALLAMAIGMTGISTLGFRVNFNDISPSHAGLLYAICNSISTITGIIGPSVTGVLTAGDDAHRISAWYKIFIIAAALYFVAAIFYAFFASGELQNWDNRTGKSFSKNRIAPETAELLEGGVPALPGEGMIRKKTSLAPWIPPTPDSQPVIAMDGTLEIRQERRRSSIAAASQQQQRRKSSMAANHLAEFQALHALGQIPEASSDNSVLPVPTEDTPLPTIPESPSTVNV